MTLRAVITGFVLALVVVTPGAAQPQRQAPATRSTPPGSKDQPHAPVSGVVKLSGIQGERPDGGIDALSITVNCGGGATSSRSAVAGGGRATGRELTFTHVEDKTSPTLQSAMTQSRAIQSAEVLQGPLKFTLGQLAVTGITRQSRAGGGQPLEHVKLSATTCTLQ